MNVPVHRVTWKPCWRVIPTRYPEERLFDRVTEPRDRPVVDALEKMTNERERDAAGEVSHVPASERAKGPGSDYIMGPFAHLNPEGSRFSDGAFGVFYAARDLDTAVAETRFHRERFLKRTKEGPMNLEMRVLTARLSGDLHDLRGLRKQFSAVYSATNYSASQDLGVRLRRDGSEGIVYDSVRRKEGECAAVLRASALSDCRTHGGLVYQWDGKSISKVFDVQERK